MARDGARRRWAVVGVVLAGVAAAPRLVAAWPVSAAGTPVADLLHRVRASDEVAWSGYAESVGRLPLPDAGPLDQVADLLGDRSRLRVWWAGPTRFRVDAITATGERDSYQRPDGVVQWDSSEQLVRVVQGKQTGIRVPQPADLLPSTLGRRLLAAAAPAELTRVGSERVAGRSAATLAVTPSDPRTLVGRIEVAVDSATGVPLRVSVTARGARRATVETADLAFVPGPPPASALAFSTPPGAGTESVRALDVGALSDRVAPVTLPATLAGLPARSAEEAGAGARSYGTGYAVVAVLPLNPWTVRRLEERYPVPGSQAVDQTWGRGQLTSAALFTALTLRTGDRGYVIVGTVHREVVEAVARALAASPPPEDGA